MSDNKQPASIAAPEEWNTLKQLVQRYAVPAAIGVGLALALLIIVNYLTNKKSTAENDASSMLSNASGPADLEAIISDFPETSSAPLALLHLASINFKNANYPVASEKYDQFLSTYPEHEFTGAADLGRIHCLESLGRLDDALEGYRTFAAAHENHYLMVQAVMGEGRTLEQLGRFEDATSVYEAYISAHPDVPGVDQIEVMLEKAELKVKTPALAEFTKTVAPEAGSLFPSASEAGADDFLNTLIQQTTPVQAIPESTETLAPEAVPAPVTVPEVTVPEVKAPEVEVPAAAQPENVPAETSAAPEAPATIAPDAPVTE